MSKYQSWLEQHLADAEREYTRIQEIQEQSDDQELYERVQQMWGYLAGLEKCLKELKAQQKLGAD